MSANQGLVNYRIIASMRVALRDGKTGLDGVPALIKRVIREDMWQSFAVAETGQVVQYARFDDFAKTQPLEGLGVDVETLKRLCREDTEAVDMITHLTTGKPGGDKRSDKAINNSNIMNDAPAQQGTTREYALRKLRKDAPELHAKVIAGDISPNAAMIEAGFRRKMVSIPTDPTGAANAIIRNFNYDDLMSLISLLCEATNTTTGAGA